MKIKSKALVRNATVLVVLFTISTLQGIAQTWQWGKRGGGYSDGLSGDPTPKEAVVDMATDRNGNVYILGIVIDGGAADIAGNALTTYVGRDIVVAKFSCDGTYKWSKVIGSGNDVDRSAIGTDTLGHVYVSGCTNNYPSYPTHFSNDSVLDAGNQKKLFLAQYDTSGNFKWLRQPNPDTTTYLGSYTTQSYDMKVMPGGDVYWFVKLHPGLVSGGNGWVTTGRHSYILQYNSSGTMTSHIQLQMEMDIAAFYETKLERMPSGKFIIAGGQDYYPSVSNFTIGGQLITHSLFVAMFSPSGTALWKKENTINARNSCITGRPLIDASSNIYLPGTICNGDTFNTYRHVNTLRPAIQYTADPFLSKIDSAGNLIWMKVASGNSANYTASVNFKSANELWFFCDYTSMHWDTAHGFDALANGGTQFGITRFSTAGAVLGMDSLKGPAPADNLSRCSTADKKGNLFIGGEFSVALSGPGISLASRGGFTDLFVAKLGNSCNCITPVSSFTTSIAGNVATFAYTGTATAIDSVVWDYGNGVRVKKTTAFATPFTYTYPARGSYTACAKVYSACGTDQSCKPVNLANVSVSTIGTQQQVKVYPNPAGSDLFIEGTAKNTTGRIFNMMGQCVMETFPVSASIPVSLMGVPPGVYLMILDNGQPTKTVQRFVHQ